MYGPYPLTSANIDAYVRKNTLGSYALGPMVGDTIIANRIGRSDSDLNGRLKDYLGKYPYFLFEYATTAVEAYHQECRLFHTYKPRDNPYHPDRPTGSTVRCRICGL